MESDTPATTPAELCLGVKAFFPSCTASKVIGRFQVLRYTRHEHLCQYIDIVKGRHERVYVISEHYENTLRGLLTAGTGPGNGNGCGGGGLDEASVRRIAFEILQGLAFLTDHGITHHNLTTDNVVLDPHGRIKLADYGLYYMTNAGESVAFPIGDPASLAPELIAHGPHGGDQSSSKVDVWALGILLLELVGGVHPFRGLEEHGTKALGTLADVLRAIGHQGTIEDAMRHMKIREEGEKVASTHLTPLAELQGRWCAWLSSRLQRISSRLRDVIHACLALNPGERSDAEQLLAHPYFHDLCAEQEGRNSRRQRYVIRPYLRCSEDHPHTSKARPSPESDPLTTKPLSEIFHFWRLAGGDLELELSRVGRYAITPAIHRMPLMVRLGSMETESEDNPHRFPYDDRIIPISLSSLRTRMVGRIFSRDGVLEMDHALGGGEGRDDHDGSEREEYGGGTSDPMKRVAGAMGSYTRSPVKSTESMRRLPPLIEREKDFIYQEKRKKVFLELLQGYPATQQEIVREAKIDIPPVLRGEIWGVILGVVGDAESIYDSIDKEKESPFDHQISIDVIRCHQYHELLKSPEGQMKLQRILKCWVAANPHLVYLQGLDSLAAPFLVLNFNNEAKAFCCLQELVAKYLHNYFLPDNTTVIQELMTAFHHLLAYHDPELATHLREINLTGDLHAISWFLNILPLDKIFHLWDTLLIAPSVLPGFFAVSVMMQLRHALLGLDFDGCVQVFSNTPTIDMQACLLNAVEAFNRTPMSISFRRFASGPIRQQSNSKSEKTRWWEDPVPLTVLGQEMAPRISLDDVLELRNAVKVVDIRPEREYRHHLHFPNSINCPPEAFELRRTAISINLGKNIVVVGTNMEQATEFANGLVRRNMPFVCVLNGGWDCMLADAASLLIGSTTEGKS